MVSSSENQLVIFNPLSFKVIIRDTPNISRNSEPINRSIVAYNNIAALNAQLSQAYKAIQTWAKKIKSSNHRNTIAIQRYYKEICNKYQEVINLAK